MQQQGELRPLQGPHHEQEAGARPRLQRRRARRHRQHRGCRLDRHRLGQHLLICSDYLKKSPNFSLCVIFDCSCLLCMTRNTFLVHHPCFV